MNAFQMLVDSQTTQAFANAPTVTRVEGGVNLPIEQQFGQIFAQFVGLPFLTQEQNGKESSLPALQFEIALAELFSILNMENGSELLLESGLENQLSMLADAISAEKEDQLLTNLREFLQLFEQEMENDSISYEALFTLFASIPELPIELSPISLRNHAMLNHESGVKVQAEAEETVNHWIRWSHLLSQLSQALKGEQQFSDIQQQIQQPLHSLISKWNVNQEWLSLLQEQIVRETGRIQVDSQQNEAEKPIFNSFLPLSLLKQSNEEQGRANISNQVSPAQMLNQENNVNMNSQVNIGLVSAGKDLVQNGADRVQTTSNTAETNSSFTARFAHMLEDMQGIFRKQISLLKNGDTAQLRVRLTPEHLGSLDIRITSENGKVIAQIITSNKLAKDVLDIQLHQLRASLTQQGIQVERMEVSHQANSSNSLLHQEHKQSQHFQQQKGQKGNVAKQAEYVDLNELAGFDGGFYEQGSQVNYAV